MKITRQNLDKLQKVSEEMKNDIEAIGRYQKGLVEKYGKNELEVEREGKKVKVGEKVLWQELMALRQGIDTGAKAVLLEKYPKFFEMLDNNDVAVNQFRQLETDIFGQSFAQMTSSFFVRAVEAIVDLKLREGRVEEIIEKAK